MTNYRKTGISQRTMRFGSRVEQDWICNRCNSIVPDPKEGCRHCDRKATKKKEKLQRHLDSLKERGLLKRPS